MGLHQQQSETSTRSATLYLFFKVFASWFLRQKLQQRWHCQISWCWSGFHWPTSSMTCIHSVFQLHSSTSSNPEVPHAVSIPTTAGTSRPLIPILISAQWFQQKEHRCSSRCFARMLLVCTSAFLGLRLHVIDSTITTFTHISAGHPPKCSLYCILRAHCSGRFLSSLQCTPGAVDMADIALNIEKGRPIFDEWKRSSCAKRNWDWYSELHLISLYSHHMHSQVLSTVERFCAIPRSLPRPFTPTRLHAFRPWRPVLTESAESPSTKRWFWIIELKESSEICHQLGNQVIKSRHPKILRLEKDPKKLVSSTQFQMYFGSALLPFTIDRAGYVVACLVLHFGPVALWATKSSCDSFYTVSRRAPRDTFATGLRTVP